MINLDKVKNIYISHEYTDMRKQVDGLSIMIQTVLKLDPFEPSLFVFCNKGRNRLKILHFDHGFWLYYHRLEKGKFKWPDKEVLSFLTKRRQSSYLLKGWINAGVNQFLRFMN